jgi:inhibitor of KinA
VDAPRIYRLSEHALTVELGNQLMRDTNNRVLALQQTLLENPAEGLLEMVPAYASLTIYLQPGIFQDLAGGRAMVNAWEQRIREAIAQPTLNKCEAGKLVEIPVCYHESLAPDLERVSSVTGLSRMEIIQLHSSVIYRVYMTGFVPGFPYMGITHEQLNIPRKQKPALRVAAGSVALAGRQTGIYPLETPGGWQVIGRTPLRLFDPETVHPFLFHAGMDVQFAPISLEEFNQYRLDENQDA